MLHRYPNLRDWGIAWGVTKASLNFVMKKAIATLTFALFLLAILCAILFIGALIPVFNYDLRIVESGSMEPTIPTGSVIFISPVASYTVGDIVTFQRSGEEEVTTHRIVEERIDAGKEVFVTKGDANNVVDMEPVLPIEISGKMWAHVPYAGYILNFFRQPIGFVLLIVLPAVLILIEQVKKIKVELRRQKATEKETNTT